MLRKVTKKWTQKDGTKIRICDMTDGHLLNTINLLQRRAIEEELRMLMSFPSFQGEMAQYLAEQAVDEFINEGIDPSDISHLYEDLVKESERRGLDSRVNTSKSKKNLTSEDR